VQTVEETLKAIQQRMLEKAREFMKASTFDIANLDEFIEKKETQKGFYRTLWCGSNSCVDTVAEKTRTTPRCISLEEKGEGKCVCCGGHADKILYFARAY